MPPGAPLEAGPAGRLPEARKSRRFGFLRGLREGEGEVDAVRVENGKSFGGQGGLGRGQARGLV